MSPPDCPDSSITGVHRQQAVGSFVTVTRNEQRAATAWYPGQPNSARQVTRERRRTAHGTSTTR